MKSFREPTKLPKPEVDKIIERTNEVISLARQCEKILSPNTLDLISKKASSKKIDGSIKTTEQRKLIDILAGKKLKIIRVLTEDGSYLTGLASEGGKSDSYEYIIATTHPNHVEKQVQIKFPEAHEINFEKHLQEFANEIGYPINISTDEEEEAEAWIREQKTDRHIIGVDTQKKLILLDARHLRKEKIMRAFFNHMHEAPNLRLN
ncbi:hypothetical protein HUU53_01235 [Candidatus Micrarchaeota archaeon]|nr:hypothetical protein [Candidatus Micrarchaeota archaeon]